MSTLWHPMRRWIRLTIAILRPVRPIGWNASSTSRIWRRCWSCAASSAAALTLFQKHSHPRHLANHVNLPEGVQSRLQVGGRMRLHQDPVFVGRAPAAAVAAPMFQEINRTIHLVGPTIDGNSPAGFVD